MIFTLFIIHLIMTIVTITCIIIYFNRIIEAPQRMQSMNMIFRNNEGIRVLASKINNLPHNKAKEANNLINKAKKIMGDIDVN